MKRNQTKDLTELAESIERDIREIREKLRRPLMEEVARGNVTGPQRSVMQALVQSDGMSLKELSQRVGLSHSTVSGIVDRLAARGMLERRVNSEDRRFTRIVGTKAVHDFVRKTAPNLIAQPLVEALANADSSEREQIVNGLKTLRRIIAVDVDTPR